MSQFVFRFQPVLSVKKQLEDSSKNELGKAVRKFEGEKEELERIERRRLECLNDMKRFASDSVNIDSLKEHNKFLLYVKECINTQKENVATAQENVEDCRKELINAVKERKTLDKLKEKYKHQYARQQLLKEQKLTDELSSYSYSLKIYKND